MKADHEDIAFELEDMLRVSGSEHDRQEYNKIHKKFRIVIELSSDATTEVGSMSDLQPTTDEIIRICPRFRILVIGKTGVGKSSLINLAFGVQNALTSHDKAGEANINTEFISRQNERFVLHDSKGFEPGGDDNLTIVKKFIESQRKMPDLKDQLHAIWLCFEIPREGGRLLETGTEEFLALKREGALGNIVVVLTKFDMFIDRVDHTLDESLLEGLSNSAIHELITKKADTELQEVCIGPLQQFAGSDIPYTTVSTKEDHKETLAHLIETTESHVRQNFPSEAWVMTSIAQRVNPGLKIKASIEKYWKALVSSAAFKNRTTWSCLGVVHTDIIAVWNFQDPHKYLDSPEFRTLMVNLVDKKIETGPTADPSRTIAIGLSMVGTIAGIMSALAGPAAPIVVPIVAGVVLAVWVHDVYQQSCVVLQRFMTYIVDLTLVLQTLYLVSESKELSRRAIKLAVAAYHASPTSEEVHAGIRKYDRDLTLLVCADRDALDKIIELMQLYSIDAATIFDLRKQIPAVGSLPDELWEDCQGIDLILSFEVSGYGLQ
ncbi:uncharacterized protein EDB91DRAFT_1165595 [Suillus paluster]|uniref:uncharacterized protein n=1 Tax=Suillus paluster TaxID=48578 RepID=UPI001B87D4A8|nr:uncharacterized protein EDB91DRAFT_1165595 [Suillus paluster]KAG1726783.1 hypothetical protein EDB91DRAFT_1165595 [Suillus paluster]